MSHPYDWKSPLSANFMPCSHAFEVFDANNVDSPLFTFVPSRPVGIVVYKSYLEIMVHRSLLFDDEKGLKEPLLDSSWNRLGLLVFLSSQHEHEYERSLEARPSVQNFLDSGKRGALVVSNKEGKSYSASRRLVESHISERYTHGICMFQPSYLSIFSILFADFPLQQKELKPLKQLCNMQLYVRI